MVAPASHPRGLTEEKKLWEQGFMDVLACYLQIVLIKVGKIRNGSMHIPEELKTRG